MASQSMSKKAKPANFGVCQRRSGADDDAPRIGSAVQPADQAGAVDLARNAPSRRPIADRYGDGRGGGQVMDRRVRMYGLLCQAVHAVNDTNLAPKTNAALEVRAFPRMPGSGPIEASESRL